MLPYDGSGYGSSLYWKKLAYTTAKNNGEYCVCWEENYPTISMSCDGTYKASVECFEKQNGCKLSFEETNKEISRLFRKFYNMPQNIGNI